MDTVLGDVESPVLQEEPAENGLDRSDNPVAARLGELVVKGSTLTADEVNTVANAVRDKMLATERDTVILREVGGAPGLEVIRRVFGTASSVPCNWHQATIFFLGSENPDDAAMKDKARLMLFSGLTLISFQVLTAMGVFVGVLMPACKTSKQCGQAGMFCALGPLGQRCHYCGLNGPLTFNGDDLDKYLIDCPWAAKETLSGRVENNQDRCLPAGNKTLVHAMCTGSENWKELLAQGGYPTDKQAWIATPLTPEFIESWCESCVTAVDWKADMFTAIDLMFDNVDAMGILDWTTLAFASYVVGLTIIGELKDMLLCEIAIERLGNKLGPWRHAINIGIFLRRAAFLPIMIGTVGAVVQIRGGDSLSVCFNTVAILFMAEADNMAYHFGLAEPQKARMETDGRVALSTVDSQRLQETRIVYLPMVIAGITIMVMTRNIIWTPFVGGFILMNGAEAVRVVLFAELKKKPKGLGMALARFLGGMFVFAGMFFANFARASTDQDW
jgi:hypothetical protein